MVLMKKVADMFESCTFAVEEPIVDEGRFKQGECGWFGVCALEIQRLLTE